MEARKITIVQTKNQKKSVIMTSATSLGELKDDLRTNGIDYDGMTFYEGLSKTELKTDESILPHDIERNGIITNELVFMLTNSEKKIKSGAMTRAEAYSAIKKNNLQSECLKTFGKNFTLCKTADLISFVEAHTKKTTPVAKTKKVKAEPTDNKCSCNNCVDINARAAIRELVDALEWDDVITNSQKCEVINILKGETNESESSLECPYSQEEINQMFREMR